MTAIYCSTCGWTTPDDDVCTLKARLDRLRASYEAKVDDLRRETERVDLHRQALAWVLYGVRNGQPLTLMLRDGYAPPDVLEVIRSVPSDAPEARRA